MKVNLDALEAEASRLVIQCYNIQTGVGQDYEERFWIQKGIEGMRSAIARWAKENNVEVEFE